ncbi:MAG: hypothetical protein KAU62_01945 [Candidatus Heimdallarchaeota archaeon]|nr:hypothetical protein [Candidatus Heimdallarchaeota archaeon]MCK4609895.1 hypothetical protein [Candidatus Heimdallarchaeota archaeon]
MKKEILKKAVIDSQKKRITPLKDISKFPESVHRYLQHSIEKGKEAVYYAKLVHRGEFRTSPTQPWFPIKKVLSLSSLLTFVLLERSN